MTTVLEVTNLSIDYNEGADLAPELVTVRSTDDPLEVVARFPGRVVYVGGGPAVWRAYAPLIRHWDITRLPYDGAADRWFDPHWLTAGDPGPGACIDDRGDADA